MKPNYAWENIEILFLFILGELWMGYLKKKKYELEEGIDVDFFVLLLCPG